MTKMGFKRNNMDMLEKAHKRRARAVKRYIESLKDKRRKDKPLQRQKKALKPKRVKLVPLPKLKRKLWKLISEDTRTREKYCVSCNGKGSQAGHYIKKSICNLIWQYAKINIHSQCVRCNVFLHGNPVEYRKWMVNKYGEETVRHIEEDYNKPTSLDFNPRVYIQTLLDEYEGL